MMENLRNFMGQVREDLEAADVLDLVPRMTLILLILHGANYWYVQVPMTVLCVLALLYRPLYRASTFWLLVTAFMGWGIFYNWYSVDNHKYLMAYWCLALTCTFAVMDEHQQRRVMAVNARLLIGLCMAFATLWKIISPDYLDGTFFEFTLLADPRFGRVAELIGGMSEAAVYHNEAVLWAIEHGTREQVIVESVILQRTAGIGILTTLLTWWTVAIEGVLAGLFLVGSRPWGRWRDAILLGFLATTYAVATVIGFAWLLATMGAAQTTSKTARLIYLLTFLLMLIYTGAWTSVALSFFAAA